MENLGLKIEEYVDELFQDLGITDLPEHKKADVFARVEEHLHNVILDQAESVLKEEKKQVLASALGQQDYAVAAGVMNLNESMAKRLNVSIEQEMKKLRSVIAKETKYERQS